MKPIGFLIITYNRPEDMLELLQNISLLSGAREMLEEVVVINNQSTADYTAVQEFVDNHPELPVIYRSAPENLGVARGRNYGLEVGKAPIVIMLDDDCVLDGTGALKDVLDEFEAHQSDRRVALVSFKVVHYDTGQMQENALPHKKFKSFKNRDFFETYFYAGGAHAVKRDVMVKAGLYPIDFFYGMEEYDMSYRIIEMGCSIIYSNKIVMLHKESPFGRKPKSEKLRMMWVNKTKVAFRYLPKRYFYTTALMWSLQYLRETSGDINGFVKGWREVSTIPRTEKRNPLSSVAMEYLRRVKARLWY